MKICFLSARPLGLQGTPGTYLFLQKIVNQVDALVVAPINNKNTVYSLPNTFPVLPVANLIEKDGLCNILPALSHFDPDIVDAFNNISEGFRQIALKLVEHDEEREALSQ